MKKDYSEILLDFDNILFLLKHQTIERQIDYSFQLRKEILEVKENNINVIGICSKNIYSQMREFLNKLSLVIKTPYINVSSLNHIYFYNLLLKLEQEEHLKDKKKILIVTGNTEVIESAKILDLDCCHYDLLYTMPFAIKGIEHIDSLADLSKNKIKIKKISQS